MNRMTQPFYYPISFSYHFNSHRITLEDERQLEKEKGQCSHVRTTMGAVREVVAVRFTQIKTLRFH